MMNRDQTINCQFDDLVQKVNNATTQEFQYFIMDSLKPLEKPNYEIAISDKRNAKLNILTRAR